ncbi:MAG: class I mannose-6-phosphate isomerase [Propionibacteriaceae bacterium]|jgi:mannose-6-phosphate isomerase|nr:class I mannose-6-phosphate isomerase [Propionibacteriaceae bacterium]
MSKPTGGLQTLPANQPAERFYRGGPQIAQFRKTTNQARREPEDWIASVASVFGEPGVGETVMPDGRTLAEHIGEDPVAWLGADHVQAFGPDPNLLVKLLDAGERLPVHVHPNTKQAHSLLGMTRGKTEAWLVLSGGDVQVGFKQEQSFEQVRTMVDQQDIAELLSRLNTVHLEPGDTFLVPAGLPHAIGQGLFVVELQEPNDASVMLEWTGFPLDGRGSGQLGLDLSQSMLIVDRSGWDADRLAGLRGSRDGQVLPAAADPFFRAQWCRGGDAANQRRTVDQDRAVNPGITMEGITVDPGFAVVIVVEGQGSLHGADGSQVDLTRGTTVLAPHDAGQLQVRGDVEFIVARPPSPTTE